MARAYHSAVTRTQLPDLRFHDLRHTCAALLIAAGAYLKEIKDHLDHASIRTTSDRYGHLSDAARERLRDHLDRTYTQLRPLNGSRLRPLWAARTTSQSDHLGHASIRMTYRRYGSLTTRPRCHRGGIPDERRGEAVHVGVCR